MRKKSPSSQVMQFHKIIGSRDSLEAKAILIEFRTLPKVLLLSAALLVGGMAPSQGEDLKVLPGHVPAVVSRLAPVGRMAATNQLRLAIGLPLRDQAGLEAFVAQVSDPKSPHFRQYLKREELTARFGPTQQDYEKVQEFAKSNGLALSMTHDNRLLLDVKGPVEAVEKAFHTQLRIYRHPTEARNFYAPESEPRVAAGLRVVDVQGLSDYARPRPRFGNHGGRGAVPRSGTAPDGSGALFGNDFRNAYVPGCPLTGAGQSVGLAEFDGYFVNDVYNYADRAGNGRTSIVVQPVLLDGYNGVPEAFTAEVALDIEMAMAMAPGLAKIVVYEAGESGSPNDVLNAMLANSNVLNLSCSWGWGGGPNATTDAILESMDAVGQTFFTASGDNQAFTTGSNSVNGVDNPSAFNAPSASPNITVVGGTTLAMNGTGAAWGSEVVWNEYSGRGSSGGISSYYAIPSWQTNVSNMAGRGGSTLFRNTPDVAANADNAFVIFGNNEVRDDENGTSLSAPLWAGFMALVNQQAAANGGPSAGFINPALYAIAAGPNYAACFHDVTNGNNTWADSPSLFYATNNYDLCTGLGTMNGTNLINALNGLATPYLAPAIYAQPLSQAVALGSNAVLQVAVRGAAPLYYQWYFDNAPLPSQTDSTLLLSGAAAGNVGSYDVVVTNPYGAVTSAVAVLALGTPPGIAAQPASQSVLNNGTMTFSVTPSGTGPFTYQWQCNGTNLPNGIITTVAGNGTMGYAGDNGPATNAELSYPFSVRMDAAGNLFIADTYNSCIRKVDTHGIITTIAGNGNPGYGGDGGPATQSQLRYPWDVTMDAGGNIFIADSGNGCIREVGTNGIITTVDAGSYPPLAVAVDPYGNLFIASTNRSPVPFNPGLILVAGSNGMITTLAGGGFNGSAYQGPAIYAGLLLPDGVAVDAMDNLFIADAENNDVLFIQTNGMITPAVDMEGQAGFSGDGGPAITAGLDEPGGVSMDAAGNLYVADSGNNRIRMVGTNGLIMTLAGNGQATYAGDNLPATNASLNYPKAAVWCASNNSLLIADQSNNRIRQAVFQGPTLVLSNVDVTNAGEYDVVVSSPYGSVTSSVVTLQVLLSPSIVTQPQSQSVGYGSNVTFNVSANGAAPLSYQWFFDGGSLAGQTNATLLLVGVGPGNAGSYDVVVANPYGSATSSVVTLQEGFPPTVTTQPQSQSLPFGSNAVFSVAGNGTAPLSYQWYFDGGALQEQTNATLVLSGIVASNAGSYAAVITSPYGSVTSSVAILQVMMLPPVITMQPMNQSVGFGSNATFSVTAAGDPPLSYQWYFNEDPLAGQTGTTLLLEGVGPTNAGSYDVVVANSYASVTSSLVTLQDGFPPGITTQPQNQSLLLGGNATFSVVADGSPPLSYQWYFDGAPVARQTNATLLLSGIVATNAGSYDVVVANPYGSLTSSVATLLEWFPPTILSQPQSQTAALGSNTTLSVAAAGSSPLVYQWYFDGGPLAGQTASSILFNGVGLTNAGSYDVVVTNIYGSVTSALAMLDVGMPPTITAQPISQTNYPGTTASFSVAVAGSAPLSYQWQFNGTNLPNGLITTVAGNGASGYYGDSGPAIFAELSDPVSTVVDGFGNLFIGDYINQRIRKVGTNGIITTVAGNGVAAFAGDGGAATNAELNYPIGVTVDANGDLFIADLFNQRIRMVGTNGIMSTVVGNGTPGYSGDGGAATSAQLNHPWGVSLDATGNMFIVDSYNQRIRKVSTNGIISTVAGNGTIGYSGDGGPAVSAELNYPFGEALDGFGNLYIVDCYNQRIRRVATNGIITTVAGNGSYGYTGDGGPATLAELSYPTGMASDAAGNLFIADSYNQRVRKVEPTGIISTVAGDGSYGYFGDGGQATSAELNYPWGVGLDASGNLFIADLDNSRIRKVFLQGPTLAIAPVSAANAGSYDVMITNAYGSVTSVTATLSVLGVPVSFVTNAGAVRFNHGQFYLSLSGLTGQGSVLIETSSNLLQWTPLFTNPPAFGTLQFVDPTAGNNPWRYYRASTLGP